ncbi:THUMP domain-containing class I SAM-dependent RNA methyltransferase [Orrella daihaiensis]|uniref:Class I SAM-dependent RNA methyltransferase n=1 Tax=Orrella daihaiensis TaxID=2782176 RepID=A0ABY4AGY3_9BURK|nr:THUMP domain-containing protein [Orrella daihaiensis]UOD49547.1 class I SAM-dependent RNA methyltransferase [Orrella daihaiensis]
MSDPSDSSNTSDSTRPKESKPGKLTLKPKNATTDQTSQLNKSTTSKSGARAHHQRRVQTEQRRTQSQPAPPDRPSRPNRPTPARPAHQSTRKRQTDLANEIGHAPAESERFEMFASCPRGLEEALAQELSVIGLTNVRTGQAGCQFAGNWSDVWRANLHSRLATRILVQVAHAKASTEDDLRQLALDVNWERWLGPEKTLRVDTSAIRSPMQSLQYCNLLVKDSICDRLRAKEGARPSIDTVRPDVRVHSFLTHDSATLYLDTSGESLFKRGWRLDKAEAPIRENLAAGLLSLSGWQSNMALLDPFCGSGTILIEAAWKALNIPPGINRPFSFERLRGHDASKWQAMRQAATESILTELAAPIVGSDISPQAIAAAQANTKRAGLKPDTIQWQIGDARELRPPATNGMIITNPPYGERLTIDADLFGQWATQLKQNYSGWQVNVISADHALPGAMRLKPKRRMPLFNGALDCRLFIFEMVSEQYAPQKARQ